MSNISFSIWSYLYVVLGIGMDTGQLKCLPPLVTRRSWCGCLCLACVSLLSPVARCIASRRPVFPLPLSQYWSLRLFASCQSVTFAFVIFVSPALSLSDAYIRPTERHGSLLYTPPVSRRAFGQVPIGSLSAGSLVDTAPEVSARKARDGVGVYVHLLYDMQHCLLVQ